MKRALLSAFLLLNLCASIDSAAAGPFSGLVVFGDSLSDTGNVQQRTTELAPLVQPIPGPFYFNGRFTNGPNFADVLSQGLGLGPLSHSLAGGNNFAYGGARTFGTPFPESIVVQDVDDQVNQFLSTRTPSATELFVVFAGADDLLDLLAANQTDVAPSVNSLRASMTRLSDAGAREFLVLNVPELGATPEFNGDPMQAAEADSLTMQFNTALAMSLDALEATEPGVTIHRFDVAGLFHDLLATPSAFGLVNVIDPAAPGLSPGDQSYDTGMIAPNVDQYLFWDTLHPTAAAHALLGQRAIAVVPEPASFALLGLGGLMLIPRKRNPRFALPARQPILCFAPARRNRYDMKPRTVLIASALVYVCIMSASAESTTSFERNDNDAAGARWIFKNVPSPSRSDAGTKAKFTIVDGQRDGNGGDLERLHDGRVATTADQPSQNFFFNAGTDGGRLVADLDQAIDIRQVSTYSWHPSSRGPQVYKLYAADGGAADFNAQPKRGTDPTTCGWKFVARIDTRVKDAEPGGQYGVMISDPAGSIGKYRYVLFDVSRTEDADPFGNTFYSEIDVIDRHAPPVAESETAPPPPAKVVEAEGGKYQFTFDTALAPDLTEWVEKELAPVVQDWYPKIVQMLPSEGFEAPTRVTLGFRADMRGTPAAAGGTRINCNIEWFRRNLKGEARGAVVHELVHVVQQYGRARRTNPNASRNPGWMVEGIADYIRWFLYEPQTKGAEISARNISRARYDASYRITGNFLNWVTQTYDKEIVRKLNAAAREGKYSEDLWKEYTGKTVQELGDEWKKKLDQDLAQ